MDMPAYMATIRGRGGFGSGAQKLVDVFFQVREDGTAQNGWYMLLHNYILAKATTGSVAQSAFNVAMGFPLGTWVSEGDTEDDHD